MCIVIGLLFQNSPDAILKARSQDTENVGAALFLFAHIKPFLSDLKKKKTLQNCRIIYDNKNMSVFLQYILVILTHFTYIANGKKSCSVLQQFTGWKCVTLFGAVL